MALWQGRVVQTALGQFTMAVMRVGDELVNTAILLLYICYTTTVSYTFAL